MRSHRYQRQKMIRLTQANGHVAALGVQALGMLVFGLAALGCDPGGVGDPCIPEDEYRQQVPGYAVTEVNVESRSFQCKTRVCLVNHFQGRVSCPYGQDSNTLAGCQAAPGNCNSGSGIGCRVPGTDGTDPRDQISVPVNPQLLERSANDAVYCSCRCDGPDDKARYCECPSGYACVELIEDLNLGSSQLAGSYCIKEGTTYNAQSRNTACNAASQNCGNDGKNP